MSLIQKKNLNYLTRVEQFFLAQKGSGLTLSAQDYHVIELWERQGLELDRLCRAIEECVHSVRRQSRDGTQVRLSLHLLREEIEAKMEGPLP